MPIPESPRALITGGGSGLGRAFCLDIARRRGRAIVADVDLAAAEETVRAMEAAGAEGVAIACDVSRVEDVERAADLAGERFGGADLVVNNAGVAVSGPVGEIPIEDWDWILGVNLRGVIHGCHVMMKRFRAEGRGHILNVASCAGLISTAEMAPYNATKAAVVALSETLHQEAARHGIGVTVLCPTFFKTEIARRGRSYGSARMQDLAEKLMEKSKLQAPDVARLALDASARGDLYVVPMADGRWLWRVKRLAPDAFYRTILPRMNDLARSRFGDK